MRGKLWSLLVIVIAIGIAILQHGRGVELQKKRDRLAGEKNAQLKAKAELRSERRVKTGASTEAFSNILAQAEELRAYSRGNNELWTSIGARIFELTPSEFLAMLQALTEGDLFANRAYVIQALFEHWCAHDMEMALEEAQKLGDSFKPLALRGILSQLDKTDPRRAEELVLSEKTGFDDMNWLRDKFLRARAIQDPEAAIAFVQKNFEEPVRDNALFTVGSTWTERDPQAAFA